MADEATDGRGWHGDPKGHAKAGEKGGKATAAKHDTPFYEEIGSEGGKASPTQFKVDDPRTEEAARHGGEN